MDYLKEIKKCLFSLSALFLALVEVEELVVYKIV